MGDNETVEDYKQPSEEDCGKKGHCFCVQRGGSTCCWCGWFDPERAKKQRLKDLETLLRYVKELYAKETAEVVERVMKEP